MTKRVFVLTGAGVSAESGLGTFRDAEGLWTKYALEDVATPEGFARNPSLVWEFYNARRRNLAGAGPNPAHVALAQLEAGLAAAGGALFLCTQNVDDLHERAGARRVHHMHGELTKARCDHCGAVRAYDLDLSAQTQCDACGLTGRIRPDVVWFGEYPYGMDDIHAALRASDLFVAVGTSGAVYPAAGFVTQARVAGIATMELNLEPSDNADAFARAAYGPASRIVPAWVQEILAEL